MRVVKNKVAPPFKQAEFDILFDEGISMEGDIVEVGSNYEVIDKRGAFYSYGEIKLGQGKENVRQHLKNNSEIRDKIEKEIRQALTQDINDNVVE